MKETLYTTQITTTQKNILRMLLYFDIFQYPLNQEELLLTAKNENDLHEALHELRESGIIKTTGEWNFLANRTYAKRISENSLSPHFFHKARKYARLINRFPFVRGVYVSGSLSKDWADDNTDVDYFIITAPQRLWVCRTMLILFKKIFLLNSRKYFCLNYFIDTSGLEIEEKNIFTATEICFLKPIVNESLFDEFIRNNYWTSQYYHSSLGNKTHLVKTKDGWLKKAGEKILSGKLGEKLDIWSMKRTLKYWRNKFPEMETPDFTINFKSNRTISKHHPSGFQKKVLEAFRVRIVEFEKDTQIRLQ